ncbi:hypothetical protein CEXT_710681 [Caerostris extrusa]|uniref:Fibronectin type-III domain-containing protein n=1 Tax=Caerostris extrusa TaxID=172846 RepID=A0AAV4PIJ3_CAEEX|nr:hypothetical protein CEXT_710681 [Caerostris extrusa]
MDDGGWIDGRKGLMDKRKKNEIQDAILNNSSIPRFLKRFLFEYPTEEVKPQKTSKNLNQKSKQEVRKREVSEIKVVMRVFEVASTQNALKSQMRGYLVETWFKSEQRWVEVKGTPITRPATKLCDLRKQYNVMRIRAYNDFGIGKPSRRIDLNKSYQQQMVRPKLYHRTMENETRLTALTSMSASPLNNHSGRG